ncbi:hypothetical protein [Bifidobacterium pseudolongum]|uniref:hypothetical protein n=1 Tax=Bifidobacterium pseudolongum TaxID=1694 RepID=UPI00101EE95B|nr:hypothetical protein [Bifidobacterium pseudolongum]
MNRKPFVAGAAAAMVITGTGLAIPLASATEPIPTTSVQTTPVNNQSDPAPSTAESANSGPADKETIDIAQIDQPVWSVNGLTLDYDPATNSYHGQLPASSTVPTVSLQAINAADPSQTTALTLQPATRQQITDGSTLGILHVDGTAQWLGITADATITVTQPYSYDVGTPAAASYDGTSLQFIQNGDSYEAAATGELDGANAPVTSFVTVNGTAYPITWGAPDRQSTLDTATWTRTGTVSGTLDTQGHDQQWTVTVIASRAQTVIAGLNLLRTDASGKTATTPINGFSPDKTDYEITLPADAATDSLALGIAGTSGESVNESTSAPAQVMDDGSRRLSITADGTTYIVTVHFEKPVEQPEDDNPAARLDGIYVNYAGKPVKGNLIAGWNPDITDYTLTIDKDAPSVYILPVAPAGVTVKADDVQQIGYATQQAWKVTTQDGAQQRVYTVRVVREHDRPTAPEAFSPSPFKDVDGKIAAPSATTTELKSHGYLLDGIYHPVKENSYVIPQGGRFAYASYAGQTVTVRQTDTSPMRYTYDLSVIAPDGETRGEHQYITTYLTPDTTNADLQMIRVNNADIPNFSPDTTEYTVPVENIEHWVITTQFDKQTGMNVEVHKDAADAIITATSADGLNRRVYTVHVVQQTEAPSAYANAAVTDIDQPATVALANTGSPTILVAVTAAISAVMGALGLAAATMRRRP